MAPPVLVLVFALAQVESFGGLEASPSPQKAGERKEATSEPRPTSKPLAVEVTAAVAGLQRVSSVRLSDPFVGWYEPEVELRPEDLSISVGQPACRVQLRPETSLRRKTKEGPDLHARLGLTLDAYAPPELCSRLRFGARMKIQVFGAGTAYRVVALQVNDVWQALPLMTLTLSPLVQGCLRGVGERAKWCPRIRKTGDKPKRRPW